MCSLPTMAPKIDLKLADDLWTRGAAHVLGADLLIRESTRNFDQDGVDYDQLVFNGPYSASTHLLIGFAFELLLKAAYLAHGGSPARLGPKGIGHDLEDAYRAAIDVGFCSAVSNLEWLVKNLRLPHLKHHFRYGGPERITMPDFKFTMPALETLAREVRAKIIKLEGA